MYFKIYDSDNDIAIVFLSGYGDFEKEQRQFEWERLSSDFNVKRIFTKDLMRAWYHDCLDKIFPMLQRETVGKKVLMVGASMGGYAALLLGHLLKCGSISFAPQTNIKTDFEQNRRWEKQLATVNEITDTPEYLDLGFVEGEQHHIYYSINNYLDKLHAERMNVKLFPVKFHGHNVAKFLKDEGKLQEILMERLEELKNGKTH